MIINVDTTENASKQLFDCLYAYYQSLDPDYKSAHEITFNKYSKLKDINILLAEMPAEAVDYSRYDLVFFCNGMEYYGIGTETIQNNIHLDNAYLITQSRVTRDHPYYSKFVWMPGIVLLPHSRLMNFSYVYPQPYYNELRRHSERVGDMVFINGSNRSWRHYAVETIKNAVPSMPVVSNISSGVTKTIDAFFESDADRIFRDFVNNKYQHLMDGNVENYYNRKINLGIDNAFGEAPLGYFGMPEYFKYRCVLFPETTWLNNDLTISDKIIKCLIHRSIPWPIGGANINSQCQEVGIQTAWNLLPPQLQCYDSIEDHAVRYQKLAEAVAWASANPEIFVSDQAKEIVESNFRNIIEFSPAREIMVNFSRIIYEHSRRH